MKKGKIIIGIILVILIIIGISGFVFFENIKKTGDNITINNIDLNKVTDGEYLGECKAGVVQVKTKTMIKDNKITSIEILKHDNGLGGKAEKIIDNVKDKQTVLVDTISGATVSSKCILKSIENGLSK